MEDDQVGTAYIHRLHLIIPRLSSVDLDIAFTDDIQPGTFLLGQKDFEAFVVRFDLSKRSFENHRAARPDGEAQESLNFIFAGKIFRGALSC
jgi:hypothetical protein